MRALLPERRERRPVDRQLLMQRGREKIDLGRGLLRLLFDGRRLNRDTSAPHPISLAYSRVNRSSLTRDRVIEGRRGRSAADVSCEKPLRPTPRAAAPELRLDERPAGPVRHRGNRDLDLELRPSLQRLDDGFELFAPATGSSFARAGLKVDELQVRPPAEQRPQQRERRGHRLLREY